MKFDVKFQMLYVTAPEYITAQRRALIQRARELLSISGAEICCF